MAVLGLNEILKRVKENGLIENLGSRELENPEGVGMDLRLGKVHKIVEGGAFIETDGKGGLGKRQGVKTEVIAEYKANRSKQAEIIIKPIEYYLVSTLELINLSADLMATVYARTSLFRAGLLLIMTKVDPGYKGTLTAGLINLSSFDVKLQLGARICNIVFFKVEGETISYRGQHQGGRVSPQEAEQQV